MMIPVMLGFIVSSSIALAAYYKESLNVSGATSAIIIGTLIYALGGPYLFFVLIFFLLSASFFGKLGKNSKPANRGALQVLANSLLASLFIVLYSQSDEIIYLVLYFTSIGVAASDTWSSEIGRLSKNGPYHIFKWKRMDKGLSGAVSFIGLFGGFIKGLSGAVSFIGLFGGFIAAITYAALALVVIDDMTFIYMIGGFAFLGAIIDSMLGIIQVKFKEKKSGKIVDVSTTTTMYHSGMKWLTNNGVNFLSNAITVGIIYLIIR